MHIIQNLANRLSEEGKILQIKNGSLLSALTTGREVTGSVIEQSDINPNVIYKQLGDKLLNELTFYKNNLFPVLMDFKSELSSEMALQKDPVDKIFKVKEYTVPSCINYLIATGKIQDVSKVEQRYYNKVRSSDFILKENIEQPHEAEKLMIPEKLSDIGLREEAFQVVTRREPGFNFKFFNNYLRTIHGSDETTNPKLVNHRTLMTNDFNCFENLEELFLIYVYVVGLKESSCKSNLSLEERTEFLEEAEKELLSAIQVGYSYYKNMIENSIVRYAAISKDGGYEMLVFTENFNIFADKSNEDAWSAVYGSHPDIIKDSESKIFRNIYAITVDELILAESRLIKGLERFRLIEETKLKNEIVANVKRAIKKISLRFYNDIVSPNLEEFCSYKSEDEVERAIDSYLASKNDSEMSFTSNSLVVDIVCGILFDKTNFLSFAKDTSGEGLFSSYIDVKDEDLISVAAISLLANRLVESIEVSSKND